MSHAGSFFEVCWAFLRLGLTSFGGPIAHLGYIRAECVEKRGWLDDETYADIVTALQFPPRAVQQPGRLRRRHEPGRARGGARGPSLCFLLPSGAAMPCFGQLDPQQLAHQPHRPPQPLGPASGFAFGLAFGLAFSFALGFALGLAFRAKFVGDARR